AQRIRRQVLFVIRVAFVPGNGRLASAVASASSAERRPGSVCFGSHAFPFAQPPLRRGHARRRTAASRANLPSARWLAAGRCQQTVTSRATLSHVTKGVRRRLEAIFIASMFFGFSWWGLAYWRQATANGVPFFYQPYFEPALMVACGHG